MASESQIFSFPLDQTRQSQDVVLRIRRFRFHEDERSKASLNLLLDECISVLCSSGGGLLTNTAKTREPADVDTNFKDRPLSSSGITAPHNSRVITPVNHQIKRQVSSDFVSFIFFISI